MKNPTILLSVLMLALSASCSKAQDSEELYGHVEPENIGFRITFVAPNQIPERLSKKFNIRPTYGIMTTDETEYRFDIVSSGERSFRTSEIILPKGEHFVSGMQLYNAVDEKVMYMEKKKEDTTHGSEIVSWVGATFTFAQNDKYVLQVFYN